MHSDNENQDDPYGSTSYEEYVPYLPPSYVKEVVESRPSSSSTPVPIISPAPVAERSTGRPPWTKVLAVIMLIGIIALSIYATVTISHQMASSQQHYAATSTAVSNALDAERQELNQNATAAVQATATFSAFQNPYPAYTQLFLNDPLTMNTAKANWVVGNIVRDTGQVDGSCSFTSEGYDLAMNYVKTPEGNAYFGTCRARATLLSDFVFQVQMKVLKGNCGGLVFRHSENRADYYYIIVCQDGRYIFDRYNGEMPYPNDNLRLAAGTTTAVDQEIDQANQIAVAAHGDTFDLYVNHQYVTSAQNSEYTQGSIGLLVWPEDGVGAEMLYTDAQVWVPAT